MELSSLIWSLVVILVVLVIAMILVKKKLQARREELRAELGDDKFIRVEMSLSEEDLAEEDEQESSGDKQG